MNRETAKRVIKIFDFFDKFEENEWGSTWTEEQRKYRANKQASFQQFLDENTIDEEEDNSL